MEPMPSLQRQMIKSPVNARNQITPKQRKQ